ncbi:MAG: PadR family transcriptional regulator [Alphaproteobacteria bacterium HGW-Alphaproteobacteria-2]|nr:MAG: PadR family transcriptional regulator [Alphaproteobacteria bacterium HGW-Alphaproteobacteria-2]
MTDDLVARIRRFNRAVTRETGALDNSFLDRGRPLGAARVLNAIGRGMGDLGRLRAYLGIDSGLLSRLLRGLEREGLVETLADPGDARRRIARLTAQGEAEFAAYEDLSNARAAALLTRHPRPEALVAAMDLVACALGQEQIETAQEDPRCAVALACLASYYAELAGRLPGGFEVGRSRDPEAADMSAPRGSFRVAYADGLPVGCVGLKRREADWAEVKRLWVAPAARGLGLARRLMAEIEADAGALGVRLLRLDTNSALGEATEFYRRSGWREIARFNDDPYPDLFFEKALCD